MDFYPGIYTNAFTHVAGLELLYVCVHEHIYFIEIMMYWVNLLLAYLKTVVGIKLTTLHCIVLNKIPYSGVKV